MRLLPPSPSSNAIVTNFYLPLKNTIHVTCDSKLYVTKINEFISHQNSKLFIQKIKESEAYLAFLSILPVNFVINHIKEHQDDVKPSKDLTIAKQLNVDADEIVTTCAKIPINIHPPPPILSLSIRRGIYSPRQNHFVRLFVIIQHMPSFVNF